MYWSRMPNIPWDIFIRCFGGCILEICVGSAAVCNELYNRPAHTVFEHGGTSDDRLLNLVRPTYFGVTVRLLHTVGAWLQFFGSRSISGFL